MTLSISLDPDVETKLLARAAAIGQAPDVYASRVLTEVVQRATIDEILAPVRAEFARSGMTEDELSDLLEEARYEARAERTKAGVP